MLDQRLVRRFIFAIALGVRWLSPSVINAQTTAASHAATTREPAPAAVTTEGANSTSSALAILPPLVWSTPPDCPAPSPLPAHHDEAPFEVLPAVHVNAEPGGFRAAVSARANGQELRRELTARTCDEINRAVLVSLSLLDAEAHDSNATPASGAEAQPVERTPAESPTLPPTNPPAPEPVDDFTDAPETPEVPFELPPTPKTSDAAATLRLSLLVGSGTEALQLWTGGGGVAFSLARGSWSGALQLTGSWPLHAVSSGAMSSGAASNSAVELDIWLGESRLRVCGGRGETVHWDVCAAGVVTLLAATAPEISTPKQDWTWLPGVGVDAHLTLPWVGNWSWVTELELTLRAHRAEFFVEGRGRVFELRQIGARLWLGPQLAF